MEDLFKINDTTFLPEINPNLSQIDCFRKLIKRTIPIKGDSDGRKKLIVQKEIGIVWWCSSYRSPGIKAGKSDEELAKQAIENYNLGEKWKWHTLIDTCIIYVRKNRDTSIINTAKELLIAYENRHRTLKVINNTRDISIKQLELLNSKLGSHMVDDEATLLKIATVSDSLLSQETRIDTIFNSLKPNIDTLRKLIKSAEIEDELISKGRGGKDVPMGHNPDNPIENY